MVIAAVVVGGTALAGAAMQSSAASDAADAQARAAQSAADAQNQSTDKQIALQKEQFDKQVQLQEPFRQAGLTAQNRYLEYLGLTPDVNAKDVNGNPVTGLQDRTGSADFGKYSKDFTAEDFKNNIDPGYNWRMSEGLRMIAQSQAAHAGIYSGAALKAAENYGQQAASQEYTNAFNRYQVNRSNQLNPLQSMIGAGQSATNQQGQASQNNANAGSSSYMNQGNNLSNIDIGAGNAQAASYMAQGNAWANGMNTLGNGMLSYAKFNASPYGSGKSLWSQISS